MNLIIKKSAILLLLVFSVISFIGSQSGTALFANYSVATGGNNFEEKKEEVNDRGFHVNELTAYCTDKGIGGKVIFENDSDDEITKKVKLFLTYHTPGASIWLPSGNYTEVEATVGAGKTTVKEYTLTISNVPFYANSIRVENKWDTTKSESFKPCKTEEVPTITPTASVTPSVSPTGTPTETPTITPTLSPTVTPSVSPIPTLTPTVTPTATPTPTVTSTPIPSQSVTPSLTLTPTVTPTQTPTVAPTNSPAPTITVTPTVTPTAGPEGPLSRCYDLEAIPSEGSAPLTVKFTGHADDPVSGGKIKEYRFDFGDASDGQPQVWAQPGREAYHRYTLAGEYEASLRVQDNAGNWRESDDCKTKIKVTSTPQVLGVKTPEELPQTGASVLLSGIGLMSLAFAGRYIYRRFKLV